MSINTLFFTLLLHTCQTSSDDVSCTTVLPRNNAVVEPITETRHQFLKKVHRIGKLEVSKYAKLSLSPNSTTKLEGKDFSFSSLKKSCNGGH